MKIYLKNTLSGNIEVFKPRKRKRVGMYHCGPTVYNKAHIGNLSSYIFSDTLRRLFENQGFEVDQVINITDVGHLTDDSDDGLDKVEQAAQSSGKTAKEITEEYTKLFKEDLKKLNINIDEISFPKATDNIKEQIDLIKKLEDKGYTYKTSDGIYFNTGKFDNYGELGNIDIKNLKEGARVESNQEKKNPTDFALWKFSKPEEKRQQEWESPWGIGFPGWHIECSAMSKKFLGLNFDIHTGGIDHIPIHHNNEIAQSEAAFDKPLAKYWLHFNHIMLNGEKISKSIGNVLYLDDLKNRGFDPVIFRYWFLTSHYATPANFTWESISATKTAFLKLKGFVRDNFNSKSKVIKKYYKKALQELNHDLGTPEAIAVIWDLIKDKKYTDGEKVATILEIDKFLGLNLENLTNLKPVSKKIVDLAIRRDTYKNEKNYEEADRIRNEIKKLGFEIKDLPGGFEIEGEDGSFYKSF